MNEQEKKDLRAERRRLKLEIQGAYRVFAFLSEAQKKTIEAKAERVADINRLLENKENSQCHSG